MHTKEISNRSVSRNSKEKPFSEQSQHRDRAFSRENSTKQTPSRAHVNVITRVHTAHTTSRGDYMEPSQAFGFEAPEGEDTLESQQSKQEENSQFVHLLILCGKFYSRSKNLLRNQKLQTGKGAKAKIYYHPICNMNAPICSEEPTSPSRFFRRQRGDTIINHCLPFLFSLRGTPPS